MGKVGPRSTSGLKVRSRWSRTAVVQLVAAEYQGPGQTSRAWSLTSPCFLRCYHPAAEGEPEGNSVSGPERPGRVGPHAAAGRPGSSVGQDGGSGAADNRVSLSAETEPAGQDSAGRLQAELEETAQRENLCGPEPDASRTVKQIRKHLPLVPQNFICQFKIK